MEQYLPYELVWIEEDVDGYITWIAVSSHHTVPVMSQTPCEKSDWILLQFGSEWRKCGHRQLGCFALRWIDQNANGFVSWIAVSSCHTVFAKILKHHVKRTTGSCGIRQRMTVEVGAGNFRFISALTREKFWSERGGIFCGFFARVDSPSKNTKTPPKTGRWGAVWMRLQGQNL